ncbi:MAG: P63C domain-containing protein [Phycisphaerales bacterium]|nr:P63C domain-containing protein [Phycisphaerales bacterium]
MAKKHDPSEMGKKGGKARAKSLTPEQRSEIARKGAAARWAGKEDDSMPKAICGGTQPLHIGEVDIPCYVLDDERRVIIVSGMLTGLGMAVGGGLTRLANLAETIADNQSMSNDLSSRLKSPIEFILPKGGVGKGYEATLLADLCDAILEARKQGRLTKRYEHIAHAAEVLLRGFAAVGIVALVDEATGYQDIRRRLALADILDKYLDDNLNQWTKTFPDDFYKHLFRLKGWNYERLKPGDIKPMEVGKFTRDEVYRRLHPGIVDELEKMNPQVVPGRRRHKHFQWLTKEIGHAALEKHIAQILVVMKLSRDWQHFMSNLQEVLPMPSSDTGYLGFVSED